MFSLEAIQAALRDQALDGWLLFDFRGSNPLAQRILGLNLLPPLSRRWFYLIPAQGTPRKLLHRIEPMALNSLPGTEAMYMSWESLEHQLRQMLQPYRHLALEYAPGLSNPYISRIDAGTLEFVRNCGVEVHSSGDLVQMFEARWSAVQWQLHLEAERHTTAAYDLAWSYIAEQIRTAGFTTEQAVQNVILEHFQRHEMTTYHPPIVAVGPHAGDPHYETGTAEIREGDLVLIDLWAKLDRPQGVYSDLTRVGYVGREVPERYATIFSIVAAARDAAITRIQEAFAASRPIRGWEVDQAARERIQAAGYGEFFIHRTGHSIGEETHGNGANMDNLETHEERRLIPGTCFSIEPGIYLPDFGIRSEVNVFIDFAGGVHVTGGPVQQEIVPVLQVY